VHTDDCCVVRHGRKTCPDRRRTRIPTRYCTLVLLLFAKSLAIATADDNSPNCFNMPHSPSG
jgi:hypothetical protein